jgi:hypothetical protein
MPHWLQVLMPASLRQSSFVTNFSMPNGLDEQYTWMSVGTLIVFVLIARELMLARQPALAFEPAEPDTNPGKGVIAVEPAAATALAPVAARASRPQRVDSRARTRKRKRR